MFSLVAAALAFQMTAPSQIDSAIAVGIRAGAYPGASVVIGTRDTILVSRGLGGLTWQSGSQAPDPDSTLYDLSSLTKVVAATPAAMKLIDADRLGLDDPVQLYLPEFAGAGKESVTVRHLLAHESGLRAFLPLNEMAHTAAEARAVVVAEPLRWTPGQRTEYSDLNAMLLGWVVEAASGESLDVFAQHAVFTPLDMSQTEFEPDGDARGRMAPVGLWRGHVIAGELHDQNAVRLGGVSGHAGLYSTASDLARYAQVYLRNGLDETGGAQFAESTVAEFTRRGPGNRALGWEMRDTVEVGSAGSLMSAEAFGHGGYTGTSIWIDPDKDLFVIILTNRVFAPRTRRSISTLRGVRAEVADAAVRLRLGDCASVVLAARTRTKC